MSKAAPIPHLGLNYVTKFNIIRHVKLSIEHFSAHIDSNNIVQAYNSPTSLETTKAFV